jgi:probable rRNA maturation factor
MSDSIVLNRQRKYPIQVSRLNRFLLQLCLRLRISKKECAVLLTNDRTIRRLNQRFRNRNKATDVLSFPCKSALDRGLTLEDGCLGDVIISVETAQRQAMTRNHDLERELRILVIHGVLHLLGHDHETDQGQMRRKELRLQRELL